MNITTNHHYREPIRWDDLTKKEQKWFDYLETEDEQQCAEFFRYHGTAYCLDQFMRVEPKGNLALLGWDGYHGESWSCGVLVALNNDGDIKVGRYSC
jgi:hypothetical protein